MRYIVGSGPAGVACAKALVERGIAVTILDAGITLEPDNVELVSKLSSHEPQDWDPTDVSKLKNLSGVTARGIPLKRAFGSDFAFQRTDQLLPTRCSKSYAKPSLALGGLSNVWGASVLPYNDKDLNGWPIRMADLKPHYEAITALTGLAGKVDEMRDRYPMFTDSHDEIQLSRQMAGFLDDLQKSRASLNEQGIWFGRSRLALSRSPDCRKCGLCMYGCPYGLIYQSGRTIENLKKSKLFRYQPGVLVKKFEEKAGGVRIFGTSLSDGSPVSFDGDAVYIGAGVFSTSRIVLESLNAIERDFLMQDSQYFLLPMVRWNYEPHAHQEATVTLSQAFLEIWDSALCNENLHLEIFGYNELYAEALKNLLGPFFHYFKPVASHLLNRLILIQGFLHSNRSGRMRLRLERNGLLRVIGEKNSETIWILLRLMKKLFWNMRHLRTTPVPFLLNISDPGRGFHSGGIFPMRETPSEFETDPLGRLQGFRRVFIVDASSFTTVPASTITFTVMANAHRIGSLSGAL